MTEIPADSDIVEIDGKRYNRVMAEEMVRDIEIANSIRPGVWAITPNTSLVIGNVALLSFCDPIEHGFLVDVELVPEQLAHLVELYGRSGGFKNEPNVRYLKLPLEGQRQIIELLRPAHEPLVRMYSEGFHTKSRLWRRHDTGNSTMLAQLVGRLLPTPSYLSTNDSPENHGNPSRDAMLEIVRGHFAANGLHYTETQVATFVTALQTKGFVVLSGISGTGKSKIATGFVEMLPTLPSMANAVRTDSASPKPIIVVPDMIKRRRIVIPIRYHGMLPPMEPGSSQQFSVSVAGNRGTGRLWYRVIRGTEQYFLFFYQDLADEVGQWQVGQHLYIDPILTTEGDRVVEVKILYESSGADLPGTSNPGKAGSNHLFLSVRPDWRDSTSLLGYYNPLRQTYEWTDFLQFVIRAGENYRGGPDDRIAWFVILDEMNLAHVEYYFADLLSVLESGRDDYGWTKEALRITYPETLADDVPPERVYLPPNLYIIGTVNMDETTHAFSPKVLDRAFTIELTDVDFRNYAIAGNADSAVLTEDEKQALLRAFSRDGRFARIDKVEAAEAVERHPEIRDYLHSLNGLLRQNRMHFGYRVFDEIAMYLAVNDENGMMEFEDAFDQAVFMKVLPKFTGSLARLRSPLHKVLAWAIDPTRTATADVSEASNQIDLFIQGKSESAWTAQPQFPVVAARVRDMLVTLETDGFVSFG